MHIVKAMESPKKSHNYVHTDRLSSLDIEDRITSSITNGELKTCEASQSQEYYYTM